MPALTGKRKRVRRHIEVEDSVVGSPKDKKVRFDGSQTETTSVRTTTVQSDTEDESRIPDKVCLTAWCQHGRMACAYYDPVKCIIYVLEDTQETPHLDLTQTLLEQAHPDIILTSSRGDDEFIDKLRDHAEASGGHFQIRPHKEFNTAKGRDRLFSLPLLSELPMQYEQDAPSSDSGSGASGLRNAYDFMRNRRNADGNGGDPTLKRWNASIRLANFASVDSSPLSIACIGALLDHLVRERAANDLEEEGISGLAIRDIEAIALNKMMHINADALYSLGIFEDESHASIHSDRTKEGLSLFGIINTTKTTLGRQLLKTWFLRPSLSLPIIAARHDAIDCFLSPDNNSPVRAMHGHLKGIKNVPRILAVIKSGSATLVEWQGLVKFTFHATMIREALTELHGASQIEVVAKLFGVLDAAAFREVGCKVNDIIEWDESAEAGRVCVRMGIDEELDNRKHVYNGIDAVLSNIAEQMSQTVPTEFAESLNVVYFPQLGFLVCVPMLEEWKDEQGIRALDGWTFQARPHLRFQPFLRRLTTHVYFKTEEMHDMDIHIGDLHSLIVDREIEIVQGLLTEILIYYEDMVESCDVCAELDCLLSFADACRAFNYRRPVMVDENVIIINSGRHPLQEQVVDTFVANDTRLAGGLGAHVQLDGDNGEDKSEFLRPVALCTGANACGKSVYLKQTALIHFVPADSATLGLVDKIFTRISTRDSVSKVQSAFMIDLNQVSLALRNSTARSLILLDEFGKGTISTGYSPFAIADSGRSLSLKVSPLPTILFYPPGRFSDPLSDGAGLFCGVLKHLLDRGPDCPKVMAATHFHDVFREDLLDPDSTPIAFMHMQVMFATEDARNGETPFALAGHREATADSSCRETPAALTDSRLTTPLPSAPARGERITYLYRVAEGLSLNSHAAQCAEIFGLPAEICARAQYVRCGVGLTAGSLGLSRLLSALELRREMLRALSHFYLTGRLLSTHELGQLLDEDMTAGEREELEEAEAVCRRFLAWDLREDDGEDVKSKLARVLGRDVEGAGG
ncbi:DNA mismatch repair protein MutS [Schizophyllum fasciatum]